MGRIWGVKWSIKEGNHRTFGTRTGVHDAHPIHTYHRQVAQHRGLMGHRWSANRLCCASAEGWHCLHPLHCCPACPTQPAAAHTSAGGVGSDGHDGEKHKKWVFFLQAEKEVSHLDSYSSQAGKGTRHREKRSRGLAQHRPEDVRQMADLAAGWSQSDLQAFSAARAHDTTLHRGCQPSLAGLLGGLHAFKYAASKRQHQRCSTGSSALGKGCLGSGGKWREGRDCPCFLFTSLPSLHTEPHRQLREGPAVPVLVCPLCQQHRVLRQPPPALYINTAHMEQKRMGNET